MRSCQETEIIVTFFHSRSYDSWLAQRPFSQAPFDEFIERIKKTMQAPENYACFQWHNGQVVALDRCGQFVMM